MNKVVNSVGDARKGTHRTSWPSDTLAIILGGGQGSRLFPLTATRSKPAVPIGGKYRLIDVPDQRLPARRHPAHLRAHAVQLGVAQPPHLDHLPARRLLAGVRRDPRGRADARQPELVSGTADAVRQAARHFAQHDAEPLPHPGRRSSLPDGLRRDWSRRTRTQRCRHHDRRAAGGPRAPRRRWASSASMQRRQHRRVRGEAQADASEADRPQHPAGRHLRAAHRRAAVHGVDGDLRLLARRAARHARARAGARLRPRADSQRARTSTRSSRTSTAATGPMSARSSRSTTPTSCSAASAAPFRFWDPTRPIYTHLRHLPGSRLTDCRVRDSIVDRRLLSSIGCEIDRVGRRHAHAHRGGRAGDPLGAARRRLLRGRRATRRRARAGHRARRRPGPRDHRQERAHRRRRAARERSTASSTPTATAGTSAAGSSSCRRAA